MWRQKIITKQTNKHNKKNNVYHIHNIMIKSYKIIYTKALRRVSSRKVPVRDCCVLGLLSVGCLTPLSHERLVANAHELGTSQDSLETSQDGLGCVLARPCMSRQVTETEREIPFFSHRLVAAVDFILSREIKFSPPPATNMQLNCISPSRLVPAG